MNTRERKSRVGKRKNRRTALKFEKLGDRVLLAADVMNDLIESKETPAEISTEAPAKSQSTDSTKDDASAKGNSSSTKTPVTKSSEPIWVAMKPESLREADKATQDNDGAKEMSKGERSVLKATNAEPALQTKEQLSFEGESIEVQQRIEDHLSHLNQGQIEGLKEMENLIDDVLAERSSETERYGKIERESLLDEIEKLTSVMHEITSDITGRIDSKALTEGAVLGYGMAGCNSDQAPYRNQWNSFESCEGVVFNIVILVDGELRDILTGLSVEGTECYGWELATLTFCENSSYNSRNGNLDFFAISSEHDEGNNSGNDEVANEWTTPVFDASTGEFETEEDDEAPNEWTTPVFDVSTGEFETEEDDEAPNEWTTPVFDVSTGEFETGEDDSDNDGNTDDDNDSGDSSSGKGQEETAGEESDSDCPAPDGTGSETPLPTQLVREATVKFNAQYRQQPWSGISGQPVPDSDGGTPLDFDAASEIFGQLGRQNWNPMIVQPGPEGDMESNQAGAKEAPRNVGAMKMAMAGQPNPEDPDWGTSDGGKGGPSGAVTFNQQPVTTQRAVGGAEHGLKVEQQEG